jgi:hypothetical protein
MASGLLVGGVGTATAVADTDSVAGAETADSRPGKTPRQAGATEPERGGDVKRGRNVNRSGNSNSGDSAPRKVKVRNGRPPTADDPGNGAGNGEQPPPPCCDGGDDCGQRPPSPVSPSDPPTSDGEYGEHRPETVAPGRPMPPMGGAGSADVLDIVPGIGPNDATHAPINVPIIVAHPVGIAPGLSPAGGVGPATGGAGTASSAAPRQGTASSLSSSPRQPLPAATGGSAAMPVSTHRVGYAPHLRGAGLSQMAASALPGLAGILILTGAGGLLGYRQAKAGQHLRPSGITRFIN